MAKGCTAVTETCDWRYLGVMSSARRTLACLVGVAFVAAAREWLMFRRIAADEPFYWRQPRVSPDHLVGGREGCSLGEGFRKSGIRHRASMVLARVTIAMPAKTAATGAIVVL